MQTLMDSALAKLIELIERYLNAHRPAERVDGRERSSLV